MWPLPSAPKKGMVATTMNDNHKIQIRELLASGLSTDEVARKLGVPKQSVAAVKAHVTRGSYAIPVTASGAAMVGNGDDANETPNLKFALERDMQDALRRNIGQLDPSLRIVDDGKERRVETGFIDILADDGKSLVVIELKSGEAPDSAVTQTLAYVGGLQAEEDRPIRGVLIAREFPIRVRLAAKAAGIDLVSYGYESGSHSKQEQREVDRPVIDNGREHNGS